MSLTIGQALEKERKIRHLTEKEMAGDIFSVANYSKIERGLQELRAQDLFKLILRNNIDWNDFVSEIGLDLNTSQSYRLEQNLSEKVDKAFCAKDSETASELNGIIQNSSRDVYLCIKAIMVDLALSKGFSKLDPAIHDKVIKKILMNDSWTKDIDSLKLLCNTMLIYSDDELCFFISSVLRKYKNIEDYSSAYQYVVGLICINYLDNCYRRKKTFKLEEVFDLFNKLPNMPNLFFLKVLAKYYRALLSNDQRAVDKIYHFCIEYGYDKYFTDSIKGLID